ncbi:MAG: sugar transferase [Flavobacteriales bacterium]
MRYEILKRGFDVVFSMFGIILVLSWLTPIVALIIILDSRGSVFFIQSRDGKDGKPFRCYKFRTMKPNIMANVLQAQPNDERITRIGNFLRASHIDELPQFYNILIGDMSFVGPRPHMHRDTEHYAKLIPDYYTRLQVLPGFTGLAQVKNLKGATSHLQQMRGRVKMDNFYVSRLSPGLDFLILVSTVRIFLTESLNLPLSGSESELVVSADADKITKAA